MIENNTLITKKILRNNWLFFQPKTVDEAVFIQEKIFELGGSWSTRPGPNNQSPQRLASCVSNGIMVQWGCLNADEPSEEGKKNALLCTSEQFDEAYVPPMSGQKRSDFAAAFQEVKDGLAVVEKQLAAKQRLKVRCQVSGSSI